MSGSQAAAEQVPDDSSGSEDSSRKTAEIVKLFGGHTSDVLTEHYSVTTGDQILQQVGSINRRLPDSQFEQLGSFIINYNFQGGTFEQEATHKKKLYQVIKGCSEFLVGLGMRWPSIRMAFDVVIADTEVAVLRSRNADNNTTVVNHSRNLFLTKEEFLDPGLSVVLKVFRIIYNQKFPSEFDGSQPLFGDLLTPGDTVIPENLRSLADNAEVGAIRKIAGRFLQMYLAASFQFILNAPSGLFSNPQDLISRNSLYDIPLCQTIKPSDLMDSLFTHQSFREINPQHMASIVKLLEYYVNGSILDDIAIEQ